MKLNAASRKRLKSSDFAIPSKRAYPIPDEGHAKAALARVDEFGTPAERAKVRAAIRRKFPNMKLSSAK